MVGVPAAMTRDNAEEELRQVVLERVAAVHAKDPKPLAATRCGT